LAESLGIKDKIIFVDDQFSQEFMVYLLNAADIYAAPSRIEGFGMIQVEAMSCGKPVISINKMGPSETIIHNKTGFLAKVSEEIKLDSEWVYPSMGFEKQEACTTYRQFEYCEIIFKPTEANISQVLGIAVKEVKNINETINYFTSLKRS